MYPTEIDEMGPIDYILVEWPDRQTTGEAAPIVVDLVERGWNAILNDRVQIANAVNATVITLDEAPTGYEDFAKGAAKKFVLNPNDLIAA